MNVERDLAGLLLPESRSIRESLARINATPYLIQLVVDTDGRLLGTITDGDIRRGLLAGLGLEDPVGRCMNGHPHVARDLGGAVREMRQVDSTRRCIPVLDEAGRPVLLVANLESAHRVQAALVMAGGFGRRLGEITRTLPKPLVPVNGKPILGHLIDRLVENGVTEILVSVHYLKDKIREYVAGLRHDATIDLLEEAEPLGTAGALGLVPKHLDGPLLMMNGDLLTQADFGAMIELHGSSGNDLTVAAAQYEYQVPFGVLRYSAEGQLEEIVEKPRQKHLVSAGIYLLEPRVRRLVRAGVRLDMPDLIGQAQRAGQRIGVFPLHEAWIDVGRPEDIRVAERAAAAEAGG